MLSLSAKEEMSGTAVFIRGKNGDIENETADIDVPTLQSSKSSLKEGVECQRRSENGRKMAVQKYRQECQ